MRSLIIFGVKNLLAALMLRASMCMRAARAQYAVIHCVRRAKCF
jgi:hypothetical protein